VPKKKVLTMTLPARMRRDERPIIRKAAKAANKSESRFLVISALIMSQFGSEEELRAALEVGWLLVETRTAAVMQIRRLTNLLEQIREAQETQDGASSSKILDDTLSEVSAALTGLGATWQGRSVK
jgi:hypothetical protein